MAYDFSNFLNALDKECSLYDYEDNGQLTDYEVKICFPDPVNTDWLTHDHYNQVVEAANSPYGQRVSDTFWALSSDDQVQAWNSLKRHFAKINEQDRSSGIVSSVTVSATQVKSKLDDRPSYTGLDLIDEYESETSDIDGVTKQDFYEMMQDAGPPGFDADELWHEIIEKSAFGFVPELTQLAIDADVDGVTNSRKKFYVLIKSYDLSPQKAEILARKLLENDTPENRKAFMEFQGFE